MAHLLAHISGFHQHRTTLVVELDDSTGNIIEQDRGYVQGGGLSDCSLYEIDHLVAGVYTFKVSVYTDGTTINDTLRVRFEGNGTPPSSFARQSRKP